VDNSVDMVVMCGSLNQLPGTILGALWLMLMVEEMLWFLTCLVLLLMPKPDMPKV